MMSRFFRVHLVWLAKFGVGAPAIDQSVMARGRSFTFGGSSVDVGCCVLPLVSRLLSMGWSGGGVRNRNLGPAPPPRTHPAESFRPVSGAAGDPVGWFYIFSFNSAKTVRRSRSPKTCCWIVRFSRFVALTDVVMAPAAPLDAERGVHRRVSGGEPLWADGSGEAPRVGLSSRRPGALSSS